MGKTGGGRGTNQHQVKGVSSQHPAADQPMSLGELASRSAAADADPFAPSSFTLASQEALTGHLRLEGAEVVAWNEAAEPTGDVMVSGVLRRGDGAELDVTAFIKQAPDGRPLVWQSTPADADDAAEHFRPQDERARLRDMGFQAHSELTAYAVVEKPGGEPSRNPLARRSRAKQAAAYLEELQQALHRTEMSEGSAPSGYIRGAVLAAATRLELTKAHADDGLALKDLNDQVSWQMADEPPLERMGFVDGQEPTEEAHRMMVGYVSAWRSSAGRFPERLAGQRGAR